MTSTISQTTAAGVLYGVLAALSFALWNIYLQRGLEKGGGARLSLFTLTLSVAAAFLPLTLWAGWLGALPPLRAAGLLWFLAAGLMTAALGPLFSAHATRRIGATGTSALRLLDPFFAFAIAALFLGERLTLGALAGIGLILVALALLQADRRESAAGSGGGSGRAAGVAFAAAASLTFTLGSVTRKLGLNAVPSVLVAGTGEALGGLLVLLPALAARGARGELRQAFRRERLDLWYAGGAAAIGTLFLNLALQRLPVPIAVALRNTTPWFALLLVPALIGRHQRAGRWMWASTALLTVGMLLIVLR